MIGKKTMKFALTSVVALSLTFSGCAELQQNSGSDQKAVSTAGGAVIGCIGGAILAHLTRNNAAQGCAAGAIIGGLVGFQKARQDEIATAEKAQQDALIALATLPKGQTAKAGEIKTIEVTATDKATHETKKYQAFDSVNIDIPLTAKGTPERDLAMAKLKTLATSVADERGSSEIIVAMTPSDARAQKVEFLTTVVKTDKGNDISVSKVADVTVPKGIERITIKAGKLHPEV
jgi:hypothetical protein